MKEINRFVYMYVHILVQHKTNLFFSLTYVKTVAERGDYLILCLCMYDKSEFDIIHGFIRQAGHVVRVPHFYLI